MIYLIDEGRRFLYDCILRFVVCFSMEYIMNNIDISKLKIVPTKKLANEVLQKKRRELSQSIWILKENIRAVDFYCYFNVRFGSPNGLFTVLKNKHDSDNLIHWDYTFDYEGYRINLICKNYYIEIMKEMSFENESEAKQLFIDQIRNDFKYYGRQLSEFRKSLEPWLVFVNPFKRLKQVIENQLTKLEDLNISSIKPNNISDPRMKATREDLEQWQKNAERIGEKYVEATSLGLSISMLLPVYAESFVNFLIFILAKPEIKNDVELYNKVLRMRINERVSSLHVNCIGFYQPVDYNEVEACKAFHSIMNKRNEVLHGNINPMNYAFDSLYFEYRTPLFENFRDIEFDTYKASIRGIEFEKLLCDYQHVQNFISYILLCLDEKILHHVKTIIDTVHPGWNKKTKRLGILSANYGVEGVMLYGDDVTFY